MEDSNEKDEALLLLARGYIVNQEKEFKLKKWTRLGFFAFGLIYLGLMLAGPTLTSEQGVPDSYAAAVRIDGPIQTDKLASTAILGDVLKSAFQDEGAKCVALIINSPGGMVGQSQMLHDLVVRLAGEHDKKVVAIGEDYVTSGAYMLASAADKIYAPESALVGSIGVIQQGYDLTGLAEKLGIKDRTFTAGTMKDPFNPLAPMTENGREKAQEVLRDLHQQFIQMVKLSRGDRLTASDEHLFNGEYWTGRRAGELGLLDGHLDALAAVKHECNAEGLKHYTARPGLEQLLNIFAM